jgi:hypothetical protein
MIVDPMKDMPRFLRSFEIIFDISDSVGKDPRVSPWLMIGKFRDSPPEKGELEGVTLFGIPFCETPPSLPFSGEE